MKLGLDPPPATRKAAAPPPAPYSQPPNIPAHFPGYAPFGYGPPSYPPYHFFGSSSHGSSYHVSSPLLANHQGGADIPSSDPPEELEDVRLFPRIRQWLLDLDKGMRGDDHNFSQFAEQFEQEKFNRVSDLVDLTVADIIELCPGIAHGTASKLLSYSKKDTEAIRKKELKRARLAKKKTPLL